VHGNPEAPRKGEAPGHQTDPFELSEEELHVVLEDATPTDGGESRGRGDGGLLGGSEKSGGLFDDYERPPKPKSPFLDDR